MNKFHLIRKIYPFCIGLALILGAEYFYMNILIGFAEPDLNGFTLEAAALMTTLYFSLSNHKSFSLLALPLIFIVSPLTIFLISHQPLHYLSFMPFMGLAAGLWGLWAALVFLCRKFSLGKYVSLLLTLAVLLFPLALWSCYFMTGSWPIFTVLLAIMQTNGKEAEEFLTSHLSLSAFFLMLAVFGYLFYFYRNYSLISIKTDCLWKRGLLGLAALLSFYLLFVSRDNMLTQMAAEAKEYQANYDLFLREKDRRQQQLAEELKGLTSAEKGLHVLVIGESQNKDHMSAYGYSLPTTPWLKEKLSDPHFILYSRAYSCHVQTVQVLSQALTAKNQYNEIPLEKAPSLIECAKAAGFRTIWISNQEKYSLYDTPTSVIASESDDQIWLNHNAGTDLKTEVYDGNIVSHLQSLPDSPRTLLIIHLMGNHRAYWERYPKDFDRFEENDWLTGTYDNSILYNDYVVSEIYKALQSRPDFQSMTYFSDHSEGIDEGLDHNASIFTWSMTRIPLYMAFSDSYVENHPDTLETLKNHKDNLFTNDLIFNSMMSLLGIGNTKYDEPGNDLTSPAYDSNPDRFRTLFGEKRIIDEN